MSEEWALKKVQGFGGNLYFYYKNNFSYHFYVKLSSGLSLFLVPYATGHKKRHFRKL